MVRTRLKLAATLTAVVLALTGFQTGGHGGSGGGSGKSGKSRSHSSSSDDDSGGGCSSSEKDNDDYGSENGPGGGSTATASPSPTSARVDVEVVDCVEPGRRKTGKRPARAADTTATLRIDSHDAVDGTYTITLEFKDATGRAVDSVGTTVTVGSYEKKTVEVAMEHPKAVDRVKDCWVYDVRKQ
ncbi:hypothetical protein [Streptomyces sp. NPDC001744]|uniref:hypothetical protein n=1 Tax=Streptomyces sp. NPDC001744 TaxID=3364606 RepID=UPI0036811788